VSVHVKVVAALLVLGIGGIVAARFLLPVLQEAAQKETSDAVATRGSIVIGTDNWIGYFPLCSAELQRRMRRSGYLLRCEDDSADYAGRFRRLAAGELQLAVATVDSYLRNGAAVDFPGTIIAVIDESKGGDAIVAWRDRAASLTELKQRPELKIAFTPDSPSEHLLRAIGAHFDIPAMSARGGPAQVEADGSPAALAKLLSRQADVAVLWEPDVSRALAAPDIVKLIGTEDTERLIVDILLVDRRYSQEQPEALATLLREYFQVLKLYRDEPRRLAEDVVASTGIAADQVGSMLAGVAWATLNENGALWLGVSQPGAGRGEEGLVETIAAAVRIMLEQGQFARSPLPDGDPYRITNRQFLAQLYRSRVASARADAAAPAEAAGEGVLARRFAPLDDAGWQALKELGTLKLNPVAFQSGTEQLVYEGKIAIDRAVERLRHYPNFRIVIKGHTGLRGDPGANRTLSQERADAVARYLMVTYGIDENRIRSIGFGASRPLPRQPGESDRAYRYRLPRVELSLAAEAF